MSKFTQGPWSVQPEEVGVEYIRVRGTTLGARFKICNVHTVSFNHVPASINERNHAESAANAHLIACAPEMYEILCQLTEMSSEDAKLYLENSADVMELLVKARGEHE